MSKDLKADPYPSSLSLSLSLSLCPLPFCLPPFPFYLFIAVLEIETRVLHIPGQYFTIEPHPPSQNSLIKFMVLRLGCSLVLEC
jgi:hypothetical protein